MNASPYALAVLDQQSASAREALADMSTDELLDQVRILGDEPERVMETWEFAAFATRHVLMVEIQRRMEDRE